MRKKYMVFHRLTVAPLRRLEQHDSFRGIDGFHDACVMADVCTKRGKRQAPAPGVSKSSQLCLAANLHVATTVDNDLHRVAAAGPGVGADLATKNPPTPAYGRRFGTAARYADADVLRTATTRRRDAQRCTNGCRWAAAKIAGKTSVGGGEHRAHSHCGNGRYSTKSKHTQCPLGGKIRRSGEQPYCLYSPQPYLQL